MVSNTINYFIDFIKEHYNYNKITLLCNNDISLFNFKDEYKKQYKTYSFCYNQSKDIVLNKRYGKKFYEDDLIYLCYTSGVTEYTIEC